MSKRNSDTESTASAFERAVRFLLKEGCRRRDRKDDKEYAALGLTEDGRTPEAIKLDKRIEEAEEELAVLQFLEAVKTDIHSVIVQMFIRSAAGWKDVR